MQTRERAKADLAEIEAKLKRVVLNAWSELMKDYAKLRHRHTKRTQASLVHDLMVAHAHQEFDGDKRAVIKTSQNRTTLTWDNKYRFRFKKMDRYLRTRNIPTQLVLDFLNQRPEIELPGTPEAVTHLHLGYKPNPTGTGAAGIYIACPDGEKIEWAWELEGQAPAQVIAVPERPARPEATPVRRVVARGKDAKGETKGGSAAR